MPDRVLRLDTTIGPLDGAAPTAGLSLPQHRRRGITHSTARPEGAIARLGPTRWLVEGGSADVDLSHGLVAIRARRALLASGVTLDLAVDAFPPGSAATTGYGGGGIPVILVAIDEEHIEANVSRSMALSLWEWLAGVEALIDAAETGSAG